MYKIPHASVQAYHELPSELAGARRNECSFRTPDGCAAP